MQHFKNLLVWEKAHQLTLDVYRETSDFPDREKFGLVSQMRRAASSVPTNIAEGCMRQSDAEFVKFSYYSLGSASELEYQLLLSKDLDYIEPSAWQKINEQTNEVKRMLISFIKKLSAKS